MLPLSESSAIHFYSKDAVKNFKIGYVHILKLLFLNVAKHPLRTQKWTGHLDVCMEMLLL